MLTNKSVVRIVNRFPWPNDARPSQAALRYVSALGGGPFFTLSLANHDRRLVVRAPTGEEALRQAVDAWLRAAGLAESGARALAAPMRDALARDSN